MSMPESAIKRWEETERLLGRFDSAIFDQVTPDEVMRLGELYTELISDLNKLSASIDDPPARARVNQLALRAYGAIYQKKSMTFADLLQFFFSGFPGLVRKRLPFVIASTLLFLAAAPARRPEGSE